jgi:cysteinyl-tRNA synthetase
MYVCGPTVYDLPHLGHGRTVLVYDVLRRYLRWSGLEVRMVSNITDIDDKIIERATATGRTSQDVAAEFEQVWWDALDALGVERPDDAPHATDYVDDMVRLVADLVAGGKAYETSDGVYLDAESVPGYGLLALQPLDSLRSGARVEANEEKRSPVDFALWKKSKPGEPSWPSPWGEGRPGWHTECVVMSLDLLGEGFDLHTGGMDLRFPHHENERAQAVALGKDFARHWMHHAFIEVEGQKMSKALKNFTSLPDLLEHVDRRAYRLLVLQAHYRSPVEVTTGTIDQAVAALGGLDAFARASVEVPPGEPDPEVMAGFVAAMDDDLDTPRAMALLFSTVKEVNAALAAGDCERAAPLVAAVRSMADAVGLELDDGTGAELDDETVALLAARDEARAARDWAAADAARDRLQAAGWVVEDTPAGTRVHRG